MFACLAHVSLIPVPFYWVHELDYTPVEIFQQGKTLDANTALGRDTHFCECDRKMNALLKKCDEHNIWQRQNMEVRGVGCVVTTSGPWKLLVRHLPRTAQFIPLPLFTSVWAAAHFKLYIAAILRSLARIWSCNSHHNAPCAAPNCPFALLLTTWPYLSRIDHCAVTTTGWAGKFILAAVKAGERRSSPDGQRYDKGWLLMRLRRLTP